MTLLILCFGIARIEADGQTNMFISNPEALTVLKGEYDPAKYQAPGATISPDSIRMQIIRTVDPSGLLDLLTHLETFYNRNSGADTLSNTIGIGACRSWILSHFDQVNKSAGGRLVTGYLEFDADICTKGHHKNPFVLIPGSDTTRHDIVLVEGHFDTRNEDRCDIQGYTPGIEDNGSGTVLIMEMARVLSPYSFKNTILLTTPTGEDEGLFGAKAWANYLSGLGIQIRAVLNNDIVGGIYCGKTSPAPSCPYFGHVDSTHVRIFSYSPSSSFSANSAHKQLARYMKYVQENMINPFISTPMTINIMLGEDRDGRGGDHTPFRQKGYTAVRIISANEHGNGTGTYPDRNHSTRDVVGKDLDQDGKLDSLFINPGYLARNTIMNGVVASMLAMAPSKLTLQVTPVTSGAQIDLSGNLSGPDHLLVGVRKYTSRSNDFDTVYQIAFAPKVTIPLEPGKRSFVSVAAVEKGVPGLFSDEKEINLMGTDEEPSQIQKTTIKNFPNPWDEQTTVIIDSPWIETGARAQIQILDILGRQVRRLELILEPGENQLVIVSKGMEPGLYSCILSIDGKDQDRIFMVRN